jgi:hypothetical protein
VRLGYRAFDFGELIVQAGAVKDTSAVQWPAAPALRAA